MAGEFVSLGEALKLISPCSDEKKDILSHISRVDTAFEVIDPNQGNKLYKFVLTSISGETRTAVAHRNLDNLTEVQEFLRNTYVEKIQLDFHANQLFKASQVKDESISEGYKKFKH